MKAKYPLLYYILFVVSQRKKIAKKKEKRNLTQNHIGILKERVLRALNNPKNA